MVAKEYYTNTHNTKHAKHAVNGCLIYTHMYNHV
jgi:hypothetical protein